VYPVQLDRPGGFAKSPVDRSRPNRDANGPAALALTTDGHAAGDGETAAGDNRDLRYTEIGGIFPIGRRLELQQRHIGGGAMRRYRHAEGGVNDDFFDISQLRLLVRAIFDDLAEPHGAAHNAPPSTPVWMQSGAGAKLPREPTMVTTSARRPRPTAPRLQRSRQPAQRSSAKTVIIRGRFSSGRGL
jgi:hypothetical protein